MQVFFLITFITVQNYYKRLDIMAPKMSSVVTYPSILSQKMRSKCKKWVSHHYLRFQKRFRGPVSACRRRERVYPETSSILLYLTQSLPHNNTWNPYQIYENNSVSVFKGNLITYFSVASMYICTYFYNSNEIHLFFWNIL